MSTTKIVFLILPNIHLLDLAGADQVFLEAKDHGVDIHIEYCSIAEGSDVAASSSGLPFGSLPHFSSVEISAGDYLFIPGADVGYLLSSGFRRQTELFQWLRNAYNQHCHFCTICTGAYVAAHAGLLKGRRCTTHWKHTTRLQALCPEAIVADNILFTEDGRLFTSAGVSSGIDMALHIITKLGGDMLSFKIARELVIYLRRSGNQEQQSSFLQYRNHIHSGIHTVQDWLTENLHLAYTLDELAEKACMSTRTLTRLFKKETGISVGGYIKTLRKEIAGELLKRPDITRRQIAEACGLKSERQLSRLLASY